MLEQLRTIKQDNLYARIISHFVHNADNNENIRACYIIGSRAQKSSYPTQYSDLDIEIVVNDKSEFIDNLSWIDSIGKSEFSYLQTPSDGNGMEIRTLFSQNFKIVDFTFLTTDEFHQCYKDIQFSNGVFARGVVSLVDKDNLLRDDYEKINTIKPLTKNSLNTVHKSILFHLVYAKNKILAGELLTAKNTIDVSIRNSLMTLIRWRENLIDPQKDLWHRARHFEKWALPEHQELIKLASPEYDKKSLEKSLFMINKLIIPIVQDISQRSNIELDYTNNVNGYLQNRPITLYKGNEYV